ncbi:hypothetical protein N0V90_009577 [Kalmusia sp. IMI 367209]|nr:hypothetical protein N0V90_009577 [Kalmusia sp. IMI 367209]
MSSIAASRVHLSQLKNSVHKAEKAVEKSEVAERALADRQDKRHRREWEDSDEDEHEDDELGDRVDETAKDVEVEEYADEEEEGFDFSAKAERLQQETLRCKLEAIEAYRAFLTDFEACVKADSLGALTALHDTMCTKLPIELREIIYSYLNIQARHYAGVSTRRHPIYVSHGDFDPNFHIHEEIEIDDNLGNGRKAFEGGTYDVCKPGGWLLNHEYVGHGLARDMAEIFYAVNDFNTDMYHLEELLTVDRTKTGLKPYECVRGKLEIRIPTTRCNGSSERAWQTTENEIEFLNGIHKKLSLLTLITHKSEVSIEMWLITSAPLWQPAEVGERRFYNTMESVRTPIYDLIHAGMSITVNHVAMSSGRSQKISEEPLNYFRMSKEEWEAEKSGRAPDWLPSKEFVLQEDLKGKEAERGLQRLLKQRWGHVKSIDAY